MSSNSSILGSGHAYSSDRDEADFLKRSRALQWPRLGLSFLILAGSAALIACEAVPLHHYKTTSQWESTGLALWPQNFDLRPTVAGLSIGCVIGFLNLIYVVAALLPSPHSNINLLNAYASASAFAGLIASLVGILFTLYLPSSTYPIGFTENETLHTWTCKWKSSSEDVSSPIYFSRDCIESRAGFALLYVLLALEILMGITAAVGTWLQRDVSRRREEQAQLERLEITSKQVYRN
ncbi:hypothetical protein N7495_002052 [Penicillium taxi]|uniref:uncharacterized protein n=1 Tax=Penicillium taxi TaxID=168475 RepID=UPI002545B9B0|nr:uncharacterized protein N7495_002052 [Penicillium taxi]KAJ5901524.1 hypothetical protein N7495_002052 [Penicillium taxi]